MVLTFFFKYFILQLNYKQNIYLVLHCNFYIFNNNSNNNDIIIFSHTFIFIFIFLFTTTTTNINNLIITWYYFYYYFIAILIYNHKILAKLCSLTNKHSKPGIIYFFTALSEKLQLDFPPKLCSSNSLYLYAQENVTRVYMHLLTL